MLGQTIYNQEIIEREFEIDIDGFAPGIYYLAIGKHPQSNTKFIKQ
jgi:hypothetical protein